MHNIKVRNCGLLSYGTVQSKWSVQTIWPKPIVSIMMACVDRPRMLLQNIHNRVCTRIYGVLTQPQYESSPLSAPQILCQKLLRTEMLKEISQWVNWIIEQQNTFYTVFNMTYFFHPLWTLLYIVSQKNEETNRFQYKYTFKIRTTHVEFQASTTIIPQWKLTADCEIKQHIWQWEAKEDGSSSAVPCVTLIISMTVTTT